MQGKSGGATRATPCIAFSHRIGRNIQLKERAAYRLLRRARMADLANRSKGWDAAPAHSVPFRVRLICWLAKLGSYVTRRSDGTVNRRLAGWLEPKAPASSETPIRGVYSKDVAIDAATGVWVRLFVPADGAAGARLPAVVYFHGGGFCCLAADTWGYDWFCRKLARRARAVVVSVNYRLAPEHRWPAAYEDGYAAVAWLGSPEAPSHWSHLAVDVDRRRCYLMGDSAGGNMVHHVGCRVAAKGEGLGVGIAGHVLLQPYFGGEERTASEVSLVDAPLISTENSDWYWRAFLPVGATRDHPAAHVFGPRDPTAYSSLPLPPSLIVVGGLDMLQDWQLRYYENLKRHNKDARLVVYRNGVHAFHVIPDPALASQLIGDLRDFMESVERGTQVSATSE